MSPLETYDSEVIQDAGRALDHLLIGAPTLESGIAWLEEKTGVRAAAGGSHPGLGTWNALASMGPRQYIEIIAPDPEQPGVETFYVPGLRGFREPGIATWAAQSSGLSSRFQAELPSGLVCQPLRQGSRVRPDGQRLAWTLAFPKHREHGTFDGALPFFIEWESVQNHPGRTAPQGLRLRAFAIRHPEPEALRGALEALGLGCAVVLSARAAISVELETPRGPVVL